MFRSRFLWKLYASYVSLVLITTAIFGLLIARRLEQDTLATNLERLRAETALLLELVHAAPEPWSSAEFRARVNRLGAEVGTRFTVLDADGTVLADSQHDPATMDNHGTRQEIVEARTAGTGASSRHSFTLNMPMMFFAAAVPGEDGPRAYVRSAVPLQSVNDQRAFLRTVVAIGTGAAVVVALGIGLLFARRVTEPLRSITAEAESLIGAEAQERAPATGIEDEIERLTRAFTTMSDQLQARMEGLVQSRNEVLAILGSMIEGVIAVDRNQRVVHMNRVAGTLLKAAPNDSVGKPLWEVTRVQEVCEILANTIADGMGAWGELRLVGSPSDQVIEMLASPLRDADGRNAGAVLVLHDVTALHRADRVRRDFVTNVSHELKTPITAIRGITETLLDDAAMHPEARERFLAKIRDQSVRLGTLVQDLLALARLESAEEGIQPAPVDLRAPVLASARALRSTSEARQQTLETRMPEEPVMLSGDAEALRQLVDNLLTNAQKYTPAGGRVVLDVHTENGTAVLEVADTGIGIESQHLDRIFERFYRVDKARSRELGGTGLGLSIVKHIALAHGGRVSVESTLGRGSRFRVELPLSDAGVKIAGYSASGR